MSRKYKFHDPEGLYFISFATVGWIDVLTRPAYKDIIVESLRPSRNDIDYREDAAYFYYPHGPLQRTELGQNKVQGMDYAYTLQGWLKGVNSDLLTPENDMGQDAAYAVQDNANANVGPLTGASVPENPWIARASFAPIWREC